MELLSHTLKKTKKNDKKIKQKVKVVFGEEKTVEGEISTNKKVTPKKRQK